MENNNNKLNALVLTSKLFNEGKIMEEDRETLKEMIFNFDMTLLGFCEHLEEANEIEKQVLK